MSSVALGIAALTTIACLLIMAGEAVLSSFNEKVLRARGAIEAEGDVIGAMRFAYPGVFIVMGIEGALTGPAPRERPRPPPRAARGRHRYGRGR